MERGDGWGNVRKERTTKEERIELKRIGKYTEEKGGKRDLEGGEG